MKEVKYYCSLQMYIPPCNSLERKVAEAHITVTGSVIDGDKCLKAKLD